jgi:hypothetical protein
MGRRSLCSGPVGSRAHGDARSCAMQSRSLLLGYARPRRESPRQMFPLSQAHQVRGSCSTLNRPLRRLAVLWTRGLPRVFGLTAE